MSGLKHNSKKVLDIIAGQTKQNATQAYKEVHPDATDITARTNAHQLLQKPSAQIYLQKHIDKAKEKVVELIDSPKEQIALQASESVLDRALGKATQRTEVSTTGITLNIDLTNTLLTDVAEQAQE
jgi:hypothetical protein